MGGADFKERPVDIVRNAIIYVLQQAEGVSPSLDCRLGTVSFVPC